MKKLLITGINGFVGEQLYLFFKDKFDVWGLDITNKNELSNFIETDIIDLERLENTLIGFSFDFIIHCAAIAHNDNNQFSAKDFDDVNSKGTYNLLKVFEQKIPIKFILFSTVAVYGEFGFINSINETFMYNPITDYAKSKVKAEEFCLENKNINTIIAIFPVIYSSNQLKDFSKRIFQKGKIAFKFGNGSQKHTFCHIDTVIKQIDFLINTNEIKNEKFQMGDNFSYSTSEIVSLYKKQAILFIPVPKFLANILLGFLSILIPSKKDLIKSIYWKLFENNIYSIKKLLSYGYKPSTYKLGDK